MRKNEILYDFLCEKTEDLTEQWYENLDKSKGGVYGTDNPETINKLKEQNQEFHVRFCSMFHKDNEGCLKDFQDWILWVAKDEVYLNTPLSAILEELFRIEKQYLDLIKEYALMKPEVVSVEMFSEWNDKVVRAISEIIVEFSTQSTLAANERLNAQQELIIEISAPIIRLRNHIGLLPLVGEINTYRAQVIFEKALEQSAGNRIEILFIDLSGVPLIDTMVAHQIFQLMDGLKLIGVETALSGISPDIAQTAIQLGLKFTDIKIYNTLAQAIELNEIPVL